jgi:SAM-dependent methyltransferase
MPKPPLRLTTTTLWDYPSRHYDRGAEADGEYGGATPAYVVWNLLQRYTRPGDLVLDPMAGGGTSMQVARDCGRRGLGCDLAPRGRDVAIADARRLPLTARSVDFAFVDPPYGTHLRYSGRPECIGELPADGDAYYREMDRVFAEIGRVLRPGRYLALYVCDSGRKGRPLVPLGFRLFSLLAARFVPVEAIAVVRHNATLQRSHWHTAAIEGNYFLRGFNHLFVFLKPAGSRGGEEVPKLPDVRDPAEVRVHLAARAPRHPAGAARHDRPVESGGRRRHRRR